MYTYCRQCRKPHLSKQRKTLDQIFKNRDIHFAQSSGFMCVWHPIPCTSHRPPKQQHNSPHTHIISTPRPRHANIHILYNTGFVRLLWVHTLVTWSWLTMLGLRRICNVAGYGPMSHHRVSVFPSQRLFISFFTHYLYTRTKNIYIYIYIYIK
jgi:hypothetical protein